MFSPCRMVVLIWAFLSTMSSCKPISRHTNFRRDTSYNDLACPSTCNGTKFSDDKYICGDPRLGPRILPSSLPLSDFIDDYNRFGGLCPGEFLAKWTDPITGYYIYPNNSGYSLNTQSQPIEGNYTLSKGMKVDRFGSEYGNFISPAAAPYNQRALPPSNLDTYDGLFPYNYHIYEVIEAFVVLAGPIAPWFGQPGQGVQYMTYKNIQGLLNDGSLKRLNLTECSYRAV